MVAHVYVHIELVFLIFRYWFLFGDFSITQRSACGVPMKSAFVNSRSVVYVEEYYWQKSKCIAKYV